ncbi:MAG: hypothetical protein LBO09_01455 [Candidatus Peribacteria bacterium]|jgi:hypothetical protein|nr:hypothetical protein [Candidatus Peribacteria bacterium]
MAIFAVVQAPSNGSEADWRIAGVSSSNNEAGYPGVGMYDGFQNLARNNTTNVSPTSTNVVPANASSVLSWNAIGTSLTQKTNAKSYTSTVNSANAVRGPYFQIGYGSNGNGGSAFLGDIQEIIRYDTGLSTTEIQKIESYLALKYGVSLDQTSPTDYLASDGTTKMRDS